ncbi:flippase [Pokkaliibacter sp. MBI-7]|uniref:flippase n=1 Tax=Pokkaliibacter sp. MBI-7 TaxID=3040600 RepID=UPI00244B18A6|nr:flippase [Pokkaliibacter sp. MBI-7]MDH2432991.1 flippase [Pokkaliibacter sp. MBI-7]
MNKYLANSLWTVAERCSRALISFVLVALIARHIGPEQFGILAFIQSVIAILCMTVSFGMDNVLVKVFSEQDDEQHALRTLSTAVLFRMTLGITLLLGLLLFVYGSDLIEPQLKPIYIVLGLSLLFINYNTYLSLYQAKSISRKLIPASLTSTLLIAAYRLWLLEHDGTLFDFALTFTLELASKMLLVMYLARKDHFQFTLRAADRQQLQTLLIPSTSMLVSSMIVVVYARTDQLMIMHLMGERDLGVYSVAIRISEAYLIIPTLIATSFFPMISRSAEAHNSQAYFDITHFCSVVPAILIALLSPWIIPMLFGESYIDAIPVLFLTLAASAFSILGATSTNFLIVQNLAHLRIFRALAGLVINVVLNYLLIPPYGLMGAAWATLASQMCASWLSNLFTAATRQSFYWQTRSLLTFGLPGIVNVLKKR